MAGGIRNIEQGAIQQIPKVYRDIGFASQPGYDSFTLAYNDLLRQGGRQDSDIHLKYFKAGEQVLKDSIDDLNARLIYADTMSSKALEERALEDCYGVINKASGLNFPPQHLFPISTTFLDHSIDHTISMDGRVREAISNMGLSVGGSILDDARFNYLAGRHEFLTKQLLGRNPAVHHVYAKGVTEHLIKSLDGQIEFIETPPMKEAIQNIFKSNGKKIAIAGTAALLSSTILASSAAASEQSSSSSSISNEAVHALSNSKPGSVSLNAAVPSTSVQQMSVEVGAPASPDKAPVSLNGSVATEAPTQIMTIQPGNTSETKDVASKSLSSVDVAPVAQVPVTASGSEVTESPDEKVKPLVTPGTEAVAPTVVPIENVGLPKAEDGSVIEAPDVEPIAIGTNQTVDQPEIVSDTANKDQLKALNTIRESLSWDDTHSAVALINKYFGGNGIATKFENGAAVTETTNAGLNSKIRDMNIAFHTLIKSGGHADANYVGLNLTVLSVLEAASNDQSVLDNADIQALIAGAQGPQDAYVAKVYAEQGSAANTILDADNGALLAGFNDGNKAKVRALFNYIQMSNVSDADVTNRIAAIQAEEAAAAAAVAQSGQYSSSPEAEAIKNLIDREQEGNSKRTFYALNHLMSKGGLSAVQAAGVVGNLLKESAGTMDPNIEQFGGGPGRGICQWEVGGRFETLKKFAAGQGKEWNDLDVQLDFVLYELNGMGVMDDIKATQNINDASLIFMKDFEIPNVVVKARKSGNWSIANAEAAQRAGKGQDYLNALNAESSTVTARRAAEEAERQAKLRERGMSFDQAVEFMHTYTSNPDNIKYIGNAARDCKGGPLSNCVSFSAYFINKYTNIDGMGRDDGLTGYGSQIVDTLDRHDANLETGTVARPFAVFDTPAGSQACGNVKCGHTGLVLGIIPEKDQIIIGEAGCNATPNSWDGAHVYSLAKFNNGTYTYAYTDGRITTSLQ